MTTVAVDVWRVNEMERVIAIVCLDYIESVPILDSDMLKPPAYLLGEFVLGVLDFLWHTTSEVVPERAVHH